LGNTLHNDDKHAAAAEAYAFGCLLDPADAVNFAHLAEELSLCLAALQKPVNLLQELSLPDGIDASDVEVVIRCAMSCPNVDSEVADRVRRAMERLDLQIDNERDTVSRMERIGQVKRLYDKLRTALTTPGQPYAAVAAQQLSGLPPSSG
jgi:hypothetical protein